MKITTTQQDLLTFACQYEDMLTGRPPEDHQWIYIPEFPVALLKQKRDWVAFLNDERATHPGYWGEDFVDAVVSGQFNTSPIVCAFIADENGIPDINIWDGNHRVAALLSDPELSTLTLPVVLGWPEDVERYHIPIEIRTLPEIANARLNENQARARQLFKYADSLGQDMDNYVIGGGQYLTVYSSKNVPPMLCAISELLKKEGIPHSLLKITAEASMGDDVSCELLALKIDDLVMNHFCSGDWDDLLFCHDPRRFGDGWSEVGGAFSSVSEYYRPKLGPNYDKALKNVESIQAIIENERLNNSTLPAKRNSRVKPTRL